MFSWFWRSMTETPLTLSLTIIFFIAASISTLDKRLMKAAKSGQLPPGEPMLPSWAAWFAWIDYIAFGLLVYLNWKFGLAIFVLGFVLAALPVLETIGNVLMAPFKTRVNR